MKITINTPVKPTRLQRAVAEAMESTAGEIEFRKMEVVDLLMRRMKKQGVNKGELAKRMGVANSRVTALLRGDSNLTIETLVRAGRAVEADLVQTFVPRGQTGHWFASDRVRSRGRNTLEVDFQPKDIQPREIKQTAKPQLETTELAENDAEAAA